MNADGYFQSGEDLLDANMNAYCSNNPVNYSDPSGEWLQLALIAGGALLGGITSVATQLIDGSSFEQIDWWDVGASALSGGLAFSGVPLWGQVAANAAISGVSTFISSGGNWGESIGSAAIGDAFTLLGGKGKDSNGAIRQSIKTIEREERRANQKYAQKVIQGAYSDIAHNAFSNGAKSTVGQIAQNGVVKGVNKPPKKKIRMCPACGRPAGQYGCGGGW